MRFLHFCHTLPLIMFLLLPWQAEAIPSYGLIGYYTFDDGYATDSSGLNNHGTLSGGVVALNQGMSFDGLSGLITAPVVVPTTNFTNSLWFKTNSVNQGLFSVTDGVSSKDRSIYLDQAGRVCAYIYSPRRGNEVICTRNTYADGQWHHVAHRVISKRVGQALFIDGYIAVRGVRDASEFNWNNQIEIGAKSWYGASGLFSGSIDDVRVDARPLSDNDILSLATADADGDGIPDILDLFPNDPNLAGDVDGDGVDTLLDAFPNDVAASVDTDGDGYPDAWNTGYTEADSTTGLVLDMLPSNATEWSDIDGDGVGDNADAFPNDIAASVDTDGDGLPDAWNTGYSQADSTTGLLIDLLPSEPALGRFTFNDNYATDSSGFNHHGTLSGGVIALNQAMSFDGYSGLITAPVVVPTTNFTNSFWFKTNTVNQGLFSVTNDYSGHDRSIYLDATGRICVYIYSPSFGHEIICAPNTYADGQWHHVAHRMTSRVGQALFVDGYSAAIGVRGVSDFYWNNQIEIGSARGVAGTGFFSGLIDDVRVDAKALSDNEILALAYPTDSDGDGIVDVLDAFPNDIAASVDTDGDGYPDSWNVGYSQADSTTGLVLDAFPNDIAASVDTDGDGYPDLWNVGYSQADSTTGLLLDPLPSDPTLGIFTFNDSYATDSSGFNHHGTLSGGVIALNQAMSFDGYSGLITAPVVVPTTNFTNSFWFKTNTVNQGLFSVTNDYSGYDRSIYLDAIGLVCVYVYSPTFGNQTICTPNTYADGQWHHVVHRMTSGVGQALFVDGSSVATGTLDASEFNWNNQVEIGSTRGFSGTGSFNGLIDDVRVYAKALFDNEILSLATADTDGDGVLDVLDAFPNDIAASVDTDGDGYPDSWNVGYSQADSTTGLVLDAFPSDALLWLAPVLSSAAHDFDGDGKSDVLWHRTFTNAVFADIMNGASVTSHTRVNWRDLAVWKYLGSSDFDGDGKSDVMWQKIATGATFVDTMNGSSLVSTSRVNLKDPTVWEFITLGDFDGDGKADVMWRKLSTGAVFVDIMNGSTVVSSTRVNWKGTSAWSYLGSGDFDGDGKVDVMWRRIATNVTFVDIMNGPTVVSSTRLNRRDPSVWSYLGSGDFDGDGKADMMWRRASTNAVFVDIMNGASIVSSTRVNWRNPSVWRHISLGDFDGDGKSDVMWERLSTGAVFVETMSGGTILNSARVGLRNSANWNILTK